MCMADRHHVAAIQDILHHGRVQLGRITASAFNGGRQPARTPRYNSAPVSASKIGDAELADGVGVAPVDAYSSCSRHSRANPGSGRGCEGRKTWWPGTCGRR